MSILSFDNSVNSSSNNKLPAKFVAKLRTVLIAFSCIIILLMIDYILAPSAEQFGESDLLPELPQSFKTMPSSTLGGEVIAQYNQFKKPEVPDVVVDKNEPDSTIEEHLSIEQQKKQSGLLRQLYIGNVVYRLSGIVKSTKSHNKYKAAISLTYVDTATNQVNSAIESADGNDVVETSLKKDLQKNYVTLAQGELLNFYVVESISNRRIVLSDNGRKLWLELFIPTEKSEN